jgi:hypothetical protein
MANVLTTIEVRSVGTTRTRDELVGLLQTTTKEASNTAKAVTSAKDASLRHAEAVQKEAQALRDLDYRLGLVKQSQQQNREQTTFFTRELTGAQASVKNFDKMLSHLNQQKVDLGRTGGSAKQAQDLQTQISAVSGALSDAEARVASYESALASLGATTAQLKTAEETLQRGINETKNALIGEREAQEKANVEKQKAVTANQKAEAAVRGVKQEINAYNVSVKGAARETRQLTAEQVAMANIAANIVTGALRSVWQQTTGLIKETAIYGARVQELRLAMETVGRVTGQTSGGLLAQEEAIKRLGITTEEARTTLTKFMVAELDVGKAAQLARAAQDLAVIAGADSSETLDRLTHGVTTLQVRVLRTAGVFVSLRGAMMEAAAAQGRSSQSFSEAEKQQLLLNKVLDYAARATGTYERSLDNAGKQMRTTTRYWLEFQRAIGEFGPIQDVFYMLVRIVQELLKALGAAPGATILLATAVVALGGRIVWLTLRKTEWGTATINTVRLLKAATAETFALGNAATVTATKLTAAARAQQAAAAFQGATFQPAAMVQGTSALTSTVQSARNAQLAALGASAIPDVTQSVSRLDKLKGAWATLGASVAEAGGKKAAAGKALSGLMNLVKAAPVPWLAAAAAIGAVAYIVGKATFGTKEWTYAKDENIRLSMRQIKVNNEDIKTLNDQVQALRNTNGAYKFTNEQLQMQAMVYTRLNEEQRTSIDNEGTLIGKLETKAKILQEINKQHRAELNEQMRTNIAAIEGNETNIKLLEERQRHIRLLMNRETDFAKRGGSMAGKGTTDEAQGEWQRVRDIWFQITNPLTDRKNVVSERLENTGRDLEKFRKQREDAYKAMADTYSEFGKVQGQTIEQFAKESKWFDVSTEAGKRHTNMINYYYQLKKAGIRAELTEQGIREMWLDQLDQLNVKQMDFSRTGMMVARQVGMVNQQLVNSTMIVDEHGNAILGWNDIINSARDSIIGLDDALQSTSRDQADYDERIANIAANNPKVVDAIRELRIQSSKTIRGIGEDEAQMARRFYDVQGRLVTMGREIRGLLGGEGALNNQNERTAGQLERMEKSLQAVRAEIDAIEGARINLGVDIGQAIPQDREARVNYQETLEGFISLRDAVREAISTERDYIFEVAQAQQTATKGIISAELLAARTIADAQRERLQGEQQLHADVIAMSVAREDRMKNEARESLKAYQEFYKSILDSNDEWEQQVRRLESEVAFGRNQRLAGLNVPNFADINTALPDVNVPDEEQIRQLSYISASTKTSEEHLKELRAYLPQYQQQVAVATGQQTGEQINPQLTTLNQSINSLPAGIANELRPLLPNIAQDFTSSSSFDAGNAVSLGNAPTKQALSNLIAQRAKEIGFDEKLAVAQMIQESSGKMNALSPKGAGGPFQIMPNTEKLLIPQINKRLGTNLKTGDRWSAEPASLMWQQHMLNSRQALTRQGITPQSVGQEEYSKLLLASYNTGDGNVQKALRRSGGSTFGQAASFLANETQNYVPSIFRKAGRAYVTSQGTKSPIGVTATAQVRPRTPAELVQEQAELLNRQRAAQTSLNKAYGAGGESDLNRQRLLIQAVRELETERFNDQRETLTTLDAMNRKSYTDWLGSQQRRSAITKSTELEVRKEFENTETDFMAAMARERYILENQEDYHINLVRKGWTNRLSEATEARDRLMELQEEQSSGWRQSEAFRMLIARQTETERIEEMNEAHDRILELQAEEQSGWRQSAEYRQMLERQVTASRIDAMNEARDAIRRLNIEDQQNNTPQGRMDYGERIMLEAEANRRKEARQTFEELAKFRADEDSGWFNSTEYRERLNQQFELARRQENIKTRDEILRVQNEILHSHEDVTERMALAYERARLRSETADDEARIKIVDNMRTIEDQQTLSTKRMEGAFVEWRAKQRGVTEIFSDAMTQTLDATFGVIDKGLDSVFKKAGAFGDIMKGIAGGFIKLGISNLLGELSGAGQEDQNRAKGFLSQLGEAFGVNTKNANVQQERPLQSVKTMVVGQMLVGGSPVQGLTNAIGGGTFPGFSPSTASGNTGVIPGLGTFGGGGFSGIGPGGTGTYTGAPVTFGGQQSVMPGGQNGFGVFGQQTFPGFGANRSADMPMGTTSIARQFSTDAISRVMSGGPESPATSGAMATVGSGAANALASQNKWFSRMGGNNWQGVKGFQSGIGASMAGMLPGVGATVGGMLGGPSRVGGIMGQVGGMALGGVAMAALMGKAAVASMFGGGAFGGAIAGLLTNPITAVVGGALLIGAVLIGRKKQRDKDEKTRTQVLGDSKTQLQSILKNVQRDRMDGVSAIAQAQQIRQDYLTQVGQLKDSKTRNIAMATVRELDYIIRQIEIASTQQERRVEFDRNLIPEFQGGGVVQNYYKFAAGGSIPKYAAGGKHLEKYVFDSTTMAGRVRGQDLGYDSVLAMLRPGEVVLNMEHRRKIGDQALAAAGVPGMDSGGVVAQAPIVRTTQNTYNEGGDTYIVMDKKFAEDMAVAGRDKIVEMTAKDTLNQGKMYTAVRKVAR